MPDDAVVVPFLGIVQPDVQESRHVEVDVRACHGQPLLRPELRVLGVPVEARFERDVAYGASREHLRLEDLVRAELATVDEVQLDCARARLVGGIGAVGARPPGVAGAWRYPGWERHARGTHGEGRFTSATKKTGRVYQR